MAWTTPRTWNSGETVTAEIYNEHIRDNMVYLHNEWISASGAYGKSARVSLLNNVSMTNSTWQKILCDTIEHDPEGWWDNTNKWFVVPETGIYLVSAMGMWNSSAAGDRYLLPSQDLGSADEWARRSQDPGNCDSFGRHTGVWTIDAAAGKEVSFFAFQNSGATLTFRGTATNSYANWFGIMRIN